MNITRSLWRIVGAAIPVAWILLGPAPAFAHCDGLDGPVVKAAQQALETRTLALVLIWVQPQDEQEIRAAFEQTLAVRGLGADARELADRFFFETLVRLHRAGEGAPFTGLKPAGRDLGPAIPAADAAIATGSLDAVQGLLTSAIQERLRRHFGEVTATKGFTPDNVAAGRVHVKAYVEFIHFVEAVYAAATTAPHGHPGETEHSTQKH
jgi:hypothetical protein